MNSSPLVSVHIAVREPAHALDPALQSVVAQTYGSLQLVLVGNASHDRSAPWLNYGDREMMVLRNFRDQGFSRAHNQALASLYARWPQDTWRERYVLLLSSYVTLASDAVSELVRVLEEQPSCAAVAPKVRRVFLQAGEDVEHPEYVDAGSLEQAGLTFSSALEPVFRGRGEQDRGQYDEASPSVLSGTFCLLVRASALMQAKVAEEWLDVDMPETYAMLDLVWRLQVLGMPMMYVPRALAWVRSTAYEPRGILARARQWYAVPALQERGMRRYASLLRIKNAGWGRVFLALPWLFIGWIRGFFEAVFDPRVLAWEWRVWKNVPRAFKKRRFLALAISRARR